MLTTYSDIRTDVIDKLGIATTTSFYSQDTLNNWIQQAERWATAYKKWPFTEGRISTTWSGAEEYSFEGYKADSIRVIFVGGKRFQKVNHEDFLIMKEEETSGEDKVFTDFGRTIIVNTNADVSGTLTAYGQYTPVPIDVTDEGSTTVFSNGDEEGNEAIVEKVLEFARTREQEEASAKNHSQNAKVILDTLWERWKSEQYTVQTHRSRGGMFKHISVLDGDFYDRLTNTDQF